MALNAKRLKKQSNGPKQEAMEAGTYPARLVQVIDLGVQEQRAYQGQQKPPIQQIMLTYEFLDEFCKDEDGNDMEDKPRWLSETIPLHSLEADLAKSTKRYYALDPDEDHGGDWAELTSCPCMVTINEYESKGETKNGVSSVSPMRPKEAAKAPELVNEAKVFTLDEPDLEIFKSLPDWLQQKIKDNLEFEGSALQEALQGPQKPAKPKGNGKPKVEEEDAPEGPVEAPVEDEDNPDDAPW